MVYASTMPRASRHSSCGETSGRPPSDTQAELLASKAAKAVKSILVKGLASAQRSWPFRGIPEELHAVARRARKAQKALPPEDASKYNRALALADLLAFELDGGERGRNLQLPGDFALLLVPKFC